MPNDSCMITCLSHPDKHTIPHDQAVAICLNICDENLNWVDILYQDINKDEISLDPSKEYIAIRTLSTLITDPEGIGHGRRVLTTQSMKDSYKTIENTIPNFNHTNVLFQDTVVKYATWKEDVGLLLLVETTNETLLSYIKNGIIDGVSVEYIVSEVSYSPFETIYNIEEFVGISFISGLGGDYIMVNGKPENFNKIKIIDRRVEMFKIPKTHSENCRTSKLIELCHQRFINNSCTNNHMDENKIVETIKTSLENVIKEYHEKTIKPLEEVLATLKKENEELKKEIATLKENPNSEPKKESICPNELLQKAFEKLTLTDIINEVKA